MMFEEHFNRSRHLFGDFWGRRNNDPEFSEGIFVFGCPVILTSNHVGILRSGKVAAAYYSVAPPRSQPPFRVQFVVLPPEKDTSPPPKDLLPVNQFTGSDGWIHIQAGAWGSCFAQLDERWAVIIVSSELADEPESVARGLLNTVLLNFISRHGFGMLHATGLVRGDRVLMLMAPHNTGKSTTALRLVLGGGFQLMCDSMVYVTKSEQGTQLSGFPVGWGKLRRDMLPHFSTIEHLLTAQQVRDETKFAIDLRLHDPNLVCDDAVIPSKIDLCLLSRTGDKQTVLRPATLDEAWDAVMINSLHDDTAAVWDANLNQIAPLIENAALHHLELGTDTVGILKAVETLF